MQQFRFAIVSFALTLLVSFGVVVPTARADGFGGLLTLLGLGPDENLACTGEGCNKNAAKCPALAGDPIWTYNGSLLLSYNDMSVGRNFPIQIERKYDSRSAFDSAVGYGWAFAHDRRLFEFPDGSIVVRTGCGHRAKFVYSGGAYVSPVDGPSGQLTALGSGSYELRYASGNVDIFDADGRISEIRSPTGERHEFVYDSRGRLPLIGTSPKSIDPDKPMLVAYQPRITRIRERGASGDLTGYYVDFEYNDTTGRLTKTVANDGREVNYTFDSTLGATRGNLVSVAGLDNYSQSFAYVVSGTNPDQHNITSITDGTGAAAVTNSYDSLDRVYRQDEGQTDWTFSYPSAGTTVITQVVKGSNGATLQTRSTTQLFNAGGYLTKETDAYGNETRYFYDGAKDLIKVEQWEKQGATLVLLKTINSTYNGNAQKLTDSVTLDSGEVITSTWTYNQGLVASEQTVSSLSAQIFRTEYTYILDGAGRPTTISQVKQRKDDGSFATTTYTYCTALEASTSGTSCPDVRLAKQIDGPRTDVADTVGITYYGSTDTSGCGSSTGNCHRRGDRKQITNAAGHTVEYLRYDAAGRVAKIRDANDVVTEMTYHPRGWMLQRAVRGPNDSVATDDQITDYETDARGNVTKVITPDGNYLVMTYDNRNNLTKIEDQSGGRLVYTYDSDGNRQTAQAHAGTGGSTQRRAQSFTTDLLGRVTQIQGSTVDKLISGVYDAAGRQVKLIDPNLVETTQSYDDLDRIISTVGDSAVSGLQSTTQTTYDAVGNVRSVIDPKSLTTSYTYDALSRLTQQVSPDSGTSSFTYDDAGNRLTATDARSITTTYAYDALNRVTSVVYPTTAENVAYLYDTSNAACLADEDFPVGRLSKITDQSGTTEYCYDRFGNTTRKVQTTGGYAFTVRYAYTKSNHLAATTYPDGTVVDYIRDTQAQIEEVGVVVTGGTRQVLIDNAAYLPSGPASSWQYGSSQTLTRNYDQDYRATSVRDPGAGGLDIGYVYDSASYLKQVTTHSTSAIRAKFDYDPLGRMLARKNASDVVQESYTYDLTGNRLSSTVGGTTSSYTYPSTNHRLTQVGAAARGYDSTGNLISIGGTTKEFVYNDANRMAVAKNSGTIVGTYLYNGRGEQVQRQTGVTTRFVYDEAGQLIGQYDSTGAAIQQYVWMAGMPVGMIVEAGAPLTANKRLKYVQPDALGTPRAIIDPTSLVAIWRWDEMKEGFGNHAPDTDPDGDSTHLVFDLRYAGQRYDQASGMHYNYFRDYDPSVGRYTQSDPIGLLGGISTYGYVGGDPLSRTDPSGLVAPLVVVAGIWVVADVALTIYDLYNTYQVLTDPCASSAEKWTAVGLTVAGIALPVAGLTVIPKIIKRFGGAGRAARAADNVPCKNSFDDDTLVQTDNGLVRIADLRIGDKVLARNEETGEQGFQTVTATINEWHETTLTVELWLSGGSEAITTTDEHPFYVMGKGFTPAGDLSLGDVVALVGNDLSVVRSIRRNFSGQFAFNLTVSNYHTYFVGQSRAWVHNACVRPFALGIKDYLDDFAMARNADTWENLSNPMQWRSGVLDALADPQRIVHFNLDGVDVWSGVSRAAAGRGGATDWELLQVQQNRTFWDTVHFWRDGRRVDNPFGG